MRPVITAATWGYVYLLHFSAPLGNPENPRALASHYVGFALDAQARYEEHLAGRGAAITRAAVERGITFELFFWPAPLGFEKELKRRKNTPRYCPICCRAHGWRCRYVADVQAEQLALPFGDTTDSIIDFPPPPIAKVDWFEIATLRNWRHARAALTSRIELDDDWI